MKYWILFCGIIFYSKCVFAYNWQKCKKDWYEDTHNPVGSNLISSTQFTSSWGSCSMFGRKEEQARSFIAANFENLKIDISRGRGDVIQSYIELFNCSSEDSIHMGLLLKDNYQYIFGNNLENPPKQFFSNFKKLISKKEKELKSCRFI